MAHVDKHTIVKSTALYANLKIIKSKNVPQNIIDFKILLLLLLKHFLKTCTMFIIGLFTPVAGQIYDINVTEKVEYYCLKKQILNCDGSQVFKYYKPKKNTVCYLYILNMVEYITISIQLTGPTKAAFYAPSVPKQSEPRYDCTAEMHRFAHIHSGKVCTI